VIDNVEKRFGLYVEYTYFKIITNHVNFKIISPMSSFFCIVSLSFIFTCL
jgi:hypothetical protein